MKRIYKYPVPLNDDSAIDMPEGAQVLTVQMQHEQVWIWALVDPDAPMVTRRFHIVGTGHPIEHPDTLTYIGTFQVSGGMLASHLFESTGQV